MATKEFFAKLRQWADTAMSVKQAAVKAALIERWLELTESLNTTLPDYQAAMRVYEKSDGTLVFAMADAPVMGKLVEFGQEPYDMRQTLLKATTSSIRVAKDGHLYLHVPLRKTTRQIKQLGGNQAYDAAKNLSAYAGAGSDRLAQGWADKLDPYHAVDPLAGLVRLPPAEGQRGSTYMTWRTISQQGKPWINRGIQARHFMRQVLQYEAADIAGRVLRSM